MKKAVKGVIKAFFLIFLCFAILFIGTGIYSITFLGVPLSINKITCSSLKIDVFSAQGLELQEFNSFNQTRADFEKIPTHVANAFVSIEDKKFYQHSGVNFPRMAKAFVNNVTSLSLKEGASTITQQLIKNTHLSSQKNLPRKFNEVRLAIQLEKKMQKDEILGHYLNAIYFGNNCWGIESASQYYFSKPVQHLTLSEGALLAGMIKSPNYYSPIKNPHRAVARRNLVISEMQKDGIISAKESIDAQNAPLGLNINSQRKNKLNSYSQSAIDEACEVLNLTQRQLAIGDYKVYTYQNLDKQLKLNALIEKSDIQSDFAVININAQNGGIEAFVGSSDYKILEHKRQIGSIAKPLFVYGPAVNENILSPASLILDEPLSIGNYTPKNVSGTYSGYVSTRHALSKSLNIPAVKTASYVGLEKISNYAQKLGLPLDEKDFTYSIALGGMTYGYNLKDLCGAYTVFTNGGKLAKPKFVKYITNSKGEVVYKNPEEIRSVFRSDTSFLITDMLKTCAKTGTARKLAELPYEVAAKTGTVGTNKGNTDAYNVSFTTEDIVGVWFGNMDNTLIKTAGGNQPTALARDYFKKIYATHAPKPFEMPASVESVKVNQFELENNHVLLRANDFTPEKDVKTELFSRFNLPKSMPMEYYLKPINLVGFVENGKAVLKFTATAAQNYMIFKTTQSGTSLLKTIQNQSGSVTFFDDMISNQKAQYFVVAKAPNGQETTSQTITLISTNDAPKAKWYI